MATLKSRSALSSVLQGGGSSQSAGDQAGLAPQPSPSRGAIEATQPVHIGESNVALDISRSERTAGFAASPARRASVDTQFGTSPLTGSLFPYLIGTPGSLRGSRPPSQLPSQWPSESPASPDLHRHAGAESLEAPGEASTPRTPLATRTLSAALSARGNLQWLGAAVGSEALSPRQQQQQHEGASARLLLEPLLGASGAEPAGKEGWGGGLTAGPPPTTPFSRSIAFGLINTAATIPSMVAFAAIVFRDPLYAPYLDLLCKFFFLSSAIHQAVFCVLSSLPFAVGQVQDVGLIFLSAMASSIATICTDAGKDAAVALGTSLVAMCLSTFVVGLAALAVARLRWAQLVQLMPLPVVGGYLGFVGWFCVVSGIELGCNVSLDTFSSWAILASWSAAGKLAATVAATAALMFTLEHVSHPMGLPSVMAAIVLAFHAVLLVTGVPLSSAQAAGWAMQATGGRQRFWELWELFNIHHLSLSGIYVQAVARQIGKAVGLVLVVCFGSCMDIAAVQQDAPKKIDFDRELTTVAVSNMATSLAGAPFTGSYIFSQTVFTMRAGVLSRLNGVVVAAAEAALFMLPFSVVQYMPNFFYGALLLWFGIEISRDWLFLSYYKLSATEYALLWLSFAAILRLGLELGIGVGIVLAALYFIVAYSRSQVTGLKLKAVHSGVVRTLEETAALDLFHGRLAAASLRGFVFFGSANSIGLKLGQVATKLVGGDDAALRRFMRSAEASSGKRSIVGEGYEDLRLTQALEALAQAPRFLILDFTRTTGLDATGARTFGMLYKDLCDQGIAPVVTGLGAAGGKEGMRQLLVAHGVRLAPRQWPPALPSPPAATDSRLQGAGEQEEGDEGLCLEFDTLEAGLRYCEDAFVQVAVQYGLCPSRTARVPLESLLREVLPKVPISAPGDAEEVAGTLRRFMTPVVLAPGECLWQWGDEAQECYIIEEGSVRIITHAEAFPAAQDLGSASSDRDVAEDATHPSASDIVSTHEYGPGCVVGKMDLYLRRPRISSAAAITPGGCALLRLTASSLGALGHEAPAALNLLQAVLMRAACRDLAVSLERIPSNHTRAD